ncbi:NADH:ubiquinone oxidoreductase subunit 5 [Ancistrocladus abbreviatus]
MMKRDENFKLAMLEGAKSMGAEVAVIASTRAVVSIGHILSSMIHSVMDAWAFRRKDAFRGERPWGDTICDPWISDQETISKLRA